MTERPILFSGPMVRAILDGRKTQTRWVVKPQPDQPTVGECYLRDALEFVWGDDDGHDFYPKTDPIPCPYGQPGDRLWVREAFSLNHSTHYSHTTPSGTSGLIYRASWGSDTDHYGRPFTEERRWRPSIHMPRWASRLTLEVVSVRVERVEDITEADAIAEGFDSREDFLRTFYDLNKRVPRGSNPWVWVVEFRRLGA